MDVTDKATLVIEATNNETHYWADLIAYRELLYFLAWRDILVRYKQTLLGVLWAVLRPVLTVAVFTIVFSKLARLPSNDVPYGLLVLAGLLPWQLFAAGLAEAGGSLVSNSQMVSKVYFPRILIPASAIVVGFIDFALTLVILAFLLVWYGYLPDWRIIALPLFIFLAVAAALGVGIWASALTVRYRDFRFIVPFLVQFGLYISPVGFSLDVVPVEWRDLYSLNPMVGIIEGFRWSLFRGNSQMNIGATLTSIFFVSASLISGVLYFRRTERSFADVI